MGSSSHYVPSRSLSCPQRHPCAIVNPLLLILPLIQADANGRNECEVDIRRNLNEVLHIFVSKNNRPQTEFPHLHH
jgi:hypothetical protein